MKYFTIIALLCLSCISCTMQNNLLQSPNGKIAIEYHADDGDKRYSIHHRKASQHGQSTLSYRVQPH